MLLPYAMDWGQAGPRTLTLCDMARPYNNRAIRVGMSAQTGAVPRRTAHQGRQSMCAAGHCSPSTTTCTTFSTTTFFTTTFSAVYPPQPPRLRPLSLPWPSSIPATSLTAAQLTHPHSTRSRLLHPASAHHRHHVTYASTKRVPRTPSPP